MDATASAFQWLANSFYVLIALAVVYLYFFTIVPKAADKIGLGSIGSIIQLTVVLLVIAILIGFVAVRTADWIFYNVLQSLPGTHIAKEVDRVTGRMVELPTGPLNFMPGQDQGYNSSYRPSGSGDPNFGAVSSSANAQSSYETNPNASANNPSDSSDADYKPTIVLKKNAMSIWAGRMQNIYNPSGRFSDNTQEMSPQDLPMGITCRVYATQPSRLWRTRGYEPWTLQCDSGDPSTATDIIVNGTAARGLTGGDFYDATGPMTVYGAGQWPPEAIERTAAPEAPGSRSLGAASPANSPAAVANASTAVGGPEAAAAPSLDVNSNGERIYVVKTGDSLARIADTYGVQVHEIVDANSSAYPEMATDNNFIKVGWELVLP